MKKIIVLSVLFFCSFGFAQVEAFDADYIEAFKKDVQAESRKMVNENLTLTEEEGKVFSEELICDIIVDKYKTFLKLALN